VDNLLLMESRKTQVQPVQEEPAGIKIIFLAALHRGLRDRFQPGLASGYAASCFRMAGFLAHDALHKENPIESLVGLYTLRTEP